MYIRRLKRTKRIIPADEPKLLILGAPRSGKKCLLQHLEKIAWEEGQRSGDNRTNNPVFIPPKDTIDKLRQSSICCMKTLLEWSKLLKLGKLRKGAEQSKQFVSTLTGCRIHPGILEKCRRHLRLLWADPLIQKAYSVRSYFPLSDSCQYLFDNLDQIFSNTYQAEFSDVFHCTKHCCNTQSGAKSRPIIEGKAGPEFDVFVMDICPNQKCEKWLHCFEKVTSVVYMVDLSCIGRRNGDGYLQAKQILSEYVPDALSDLIASYLIFLDLEILNTLNMFQRMCKQFAKWKVQIILVFNKKDIFLQNLEHFQKRGLNLIEMVFGSYGRAEYPTATSEVLDFIFEEFQKAPACPKDPVYMYTSYLSDVGNGAHVANSLRQMILVRHYFRPGATWSIKD